MIKAVLIVNNFGKPRLTKFYDQTPVGKQQDLIRQLFSTISKRPPNSSNIIFDETKFGQHTSVVYKIFATLFFIFVIDDLESELVILDLIQVFVEALDKSFENVCELDIVYNFNKAHQILDEMIMGGQILEIDANEIYKNVNEIQRLEKLPGPSPVVLKPRN